MSAKDLFTTKIPEKLKKNADKTTGIKSIYEFNVSGDEGGVWSLDFTQGEGKVVEGSTGKANCTVSITTENLGQILDGKLNPQMAFMTGKLKVAGDMGLAIKLGSILD
ncbi:MAG: SCP2 sterol-binding domain-containing protein [Deltaproteobacteria bacterium]|nr:SCP2 sterol-binding domain-containing protein [Deltaproteobacteria bacterium]